MNLEKEILKYMQNVINNLHNERDFYKSLSLANAIENGAVAKMSNGKMSSHQWRIGKKKVKLEQLSY